MRCGGDQTVFDRHCAPGHAKPREQFRPPRASLCISRQTESLDTRIEPPLESRALLALAQQQNAKANLAEDDGIDGDHRRPGPVEYHLRLILRSVRSG